MTTKSQQGLHKKIQADLISFAARIMIAAHQGKFWNPSKVLAMVFTALLR